ncbi:MAG TPA: hypothetical protein VN696_17625 [Pyrinomonadaceae bacterium]|nr:hypothetical protein [Pyrinomonadaceae bacterium]
MAQDDTSKRASVTVQLALSYPKEQEKPDVRVYLFDSSERLVESQPAKESLQFSIDPSKRYRVTVGPNLLQKDKAPTDLRARLSKAGAVSRDISAQDAGRAISLSVADSLISLWLFRCINIHGTVRKSLGGTPPSYAPICSGKVEVFVIDLACSLARLSNADLLTIKSQTLATMIGVEIADLISFNFSDFAAVSALAGGLFPLTGNALRNYIVAHRSELAPFMCNLIPEWAICYTQLPDAPIQSDGTFSLHYCFFFWEFPPDIYFEVKQTIGGVEREVADPDIMCTTMWRYDGSLSAVITVEDPTAVACMPTGPDLGLLYVWPTAIGNIDLFQINGLETPGAGTGLLPGGPAGTAWGGTLPLQVIFDPNLRANNIKWYRWSYRFGSEAFAPITTAVTHRWMQVVGMNILIHPVLLGPHPVGTEENLFEIPDPNLPWININDPADRPFAYFDSTAGQTPGRSGMVTLKLEMFDISGTHVPCANAGHGGIFTFMLLPDAMDPAHPALAPNIDAQGNMIFVLRVDNNPTFADLPDNGVSVWNGAFHRADLCGMLHYGAGTDNVGIDYVATHPNNFIDWGLSVSRGFSGVVASASGDTSSTSTLTRNASVLLGSCTQAAFAVNLNTYARITNGYGRQSQYDRSDTIAFALLHP